MLLSVSQLVTLFGICYGVFVVIGVVHLLGWIAEKVPSLQDVVALRRPTEEES